MAQEQKKNSPKKGGQGKGRSGHHAARFFENLDHNKDETVTREEFGQAERLQKIEEQTKDKLFARLDKDSDGILTKQEVHSPEEKRPPEDFGHILRQADENQDRKITFEEFSAHQRFSKLKEHHKTSLFARLDQNKDGIINRLDRRERAHPGKALKDFDKDQSGGLSLEEFLKMPHVQRVSEKVGEKNFSRLDQDANGEISLEELKKSQRIFKRGSQEIPRRKSRQDELQKEK